MGKKDTSLEDELREIQDEAKAEFSLRDRLANKNNRRKTVTVYSDAEAGAKLGYAIDEVLNGGIRTGRRLRKGLAGELDAAKAEGEALAAQIDALDEQGAEIPEADTKRAREISAEIKRLNKAIEATTAALNASSFVFTLHTLPEAIIKDVRRKTRKALGIKGKGIPEARQEEFGEEYTIQMLVASTESWVDTERGEKHTTLHAENAREFQGFLPKGQFPRLDEAMVELSIEAAIGNVATDSADF